MSSALLSVPVIVISVEKSGWSGGHDVLVDMSWCCDDSSLMGVLAEMGQTSGNLRGDRGSREAKMSSQPDTSGCTVSIVAVYPDMIIKKVTH